MAQLIERFLNDTVLGFFALVSLFLMIAPAVFSFTAAGQSALLAAELTIIALFALEYCAAWVNATDKRQFMLNRWRIIDLLIIVAALVALLPATPDVLRNSPALRLLRLGRLALLGTRSGFALTTAAEPLLLQNHLPAGEVQVLALQASGTSFKDISWQAGLNRIGTAEPDWIFISGINEDRLEPIGDALGIPPETVLGLFKSSVPQIGRLERYTALFVRYPLPMQADGRLRRTPVVLLSTSNNVVVLSRERTDLAARVEARLAGGDGGVERMSKAMVALISEIIRGYAEVITRLESSLLSIEAEQLTLKDASFLARTFDLRADILRVRSSLKHLKNVARDLASGDLTIADTQAAGGDAFRLLAEDINDHYDSIEDLRESLQTLVDFRLNVSSFQMNRVMRLLALLTALALIPATAGGLLGMNLQDTPWPGTLAQVSFGIAAGMALSLYLFAIKGWLR